MTARALRRLGAVAILVVASGAAAADHLDGQYVKAGPHLGLSFRDHGRGADPTRWAVGPKLGYLFVGLQFKLGPRIAR